MGKGRGKGSEGSAEDLDVVVPWKDGFECATSNNPTTMVRAVRRQALATRFLRVYDDALRPELCAALYDDAVAHNKPWGAYVTLADARNVAGAPSDRDAWAREVVRTLFLERAADAVDLEAAGAHGVAVWCLASGVGNSVDYHLDYCELHRHETNEIVPPLYASTVQLSDLADGAADDARRVEGGAFVVNSGGLAHYAAYGYKSRLRKGALAGGGWHRIPYVLNRAIVHDGEWPHASEEVKALPAGKKRVILGLNVFGDRVAEVNARAPEHSDAFNKTVKIYQATARAKRAGGGGLTVEALKKNKPLARLFVGLARARAGEDDDAAGAATFAPGDRVRAKWRKGLRRWPATVKRVYDDGTLDLHYDDGTRWNGAPPGIARPLEA